MTDILSFQGDYRWLSNFWTAPVQLDGVVYPCVENAYQAAKTVPNNRQGFRTCKPGVAKALGKYIVLREGWDAMKLDVMTDLIRQKFRANSFLGIRLQMTGTAKIVEGNHWGDEFWGMCNGVGENHLGKILMAHRTVLQTPKECITIKDLQTI